MVNPCPGHHHVTSSPSLLFKNFGFLWVINILDILDFSAHPPTNVLLFYSISKAKQQSTILVAGQEGSATMSSSSSSGTDSQYFSTTKKGEIHEVLPGPQSCFFQLLLRLLSLYHSDLQLKSELNSLDKEKIKSAVKKTIAAMTVGNANTWHIKQNDLIPTGGFCACADPVVLMQAPLSGKFISKTLTAYVGP